MRQLANDQVQLMHTLAHDQFSVVGHDRGARCAYRLALDHPRAVTRLAVLDIVPTGEAFTRATMDFASDSDCGHSWRRLSRCPSG